MFCRELTLVGLALALSSALAADSTDEKCQYLRITPTGLTLESTILLEKSSKGLTISSTTQRGQTTLKVTARYDEADRLVAGTAELTGQDGKKKTARVTAKGDKAQIVRDGHGKEPQDFEVPPGVIITSAPDWTDTFLLCRRYDRTKGGKQEFAGLWIHPEQPAQRLTFTVERLGKATIDHGGQKIELDRLGIHIRNNSPYLGWADQQGRMIRLAGLPFKEGMSVELVREGYEQSAAKLKPGEK